MDKNNSYKSRRCKETLPTSKISKPIIVRFEDDKPVYITGLDPYNVKKLTFFQIN